MTHSSCVLRFSGCLLSVPCRAEREEVLQCYYFDRRAALQVLFVTADNAVNPGLLRTNGDQRVFEVFHRQGHGADAVLVCDRNNFVGGEQKVQHPPCRPQTTYFAIKAEDVRRGVGGEAAGELAVLAPQEYLSCFPSIGHDYL